MRARNRRVFTALGLAGLAVLCCCATAASVGTAAAAGTTKLPNPFTITARWSAKSLGLNHPRRLAVAPSGNLYVTDLSQRVTEVSPAGKVLRRWGSPGSGPGQFHFISFDPSDPKDLSSNIAVAPDGKVYVTDSGNARVQVFTAQGRFVRQFGSFGNGKNGFLQPRDLVVDRANSVYVVDDRLKNLRKFSPTGKLVWTLDGVHSSDPDLVGYYYLSMIDSHGRLLVLNGKGRVFYVDRNGHKLDAFGERSQFPATACDATVDPAGFVYVAGCERGAATEVFNPAHEPVGEWLASPIATPPRFGPRGEIVAIAWDTRSRIDRGGDILRLRITHP